MFKPILSPASGKLRVLGYCSGSGNTLWKAYELQKQLEQVVSFFRDNRLGDYYRN